MRASHEWLRAFVPHALAPADVERLLSTHVATVDAAEPLRADLAPIVVARVIAAAPHPDSDHLWVTKVDDGSGTPLDVVCGAPNVTVGTLYPFARAGTTLPGGLTIVKRKIRGEISNGMLCSARELGLGEEQNGILALTVDVPPGTNFLDAVPVGDVKYEIDVLPNRPDLLSHVGLARELSALASVPMRRPPELSGLVGLPKPALAPGEGKAAGVTVRIDDATGCPRYLAAVIRGVKIGPSPVWLQERLASVGLRSISNVVDVTNYFLHGYGQPMHAFDLAKLDGSAVVIRRATAGEKLTTLDGVERSLTSDMLVIADAHRAAAVAGVMGGRDSEVTDATTDILLEVANFDPRSVRRTRRALGLNTDASHRFERGTDPGEVAQTGALAAALIASIAGGEVDGTPILVGAPITGREAVSVRPSRVSKLLGARITGDEISTRLSGIGFVVKAGAADFLSVTAPSWRHDVSRDVDLIEEVARLRGYDSLSDALTPFRPSSAPDHVFHATSRRIRDVLVARGFAEVRPLPFVRGDDATHVRVTNPLAEDEPHLRRTVLETLEPRAEHNLSRHEGSLRLFEIGSAFGSVDGRVHETCRIAALFMGARRPPHFTEPDPPVFDAWDAKTLGATILQAAFPGGGNVAEGGDGHLWMLRAGNEIVGSVRSVRLDAPPWASPAFGIELTLGVLSADPVAPRGQHAYERPDAESALQRHVRYRALPVMPAAEFDLAFLTPENVPAGRVEDVLRAAAGELLESLVLFDEFRGAGIEAGHRSLAWRLTFRHPERTLNEKEIAGRRQKLIATVEKELGVVSRSS